MNGCNKCGRQTTRSRLCKFCALDERHGQALITEENENDRESAETLTIECADCGLIHEADAHARKTCPGCGYEGFRPVISQ